MNTKNPVIMIHVKVCLGTNCSVMGGQVILEALEGEPLLKGKIHVETVKCFDEECDGGNKSPIVAIDGVKYLNASIEKISAILIGKATEKGGS